MSIFKSTFRSGIITQIRKREAAIGGDNAITLYQGSTGKPLKLQLPESGIRTPQAIQYYNARNAWIRMTSGVNVNNDGGTLAQNGVLLGGNTTPGSSPKTGIGEARANAYSTKSPGGTDHRLGIRPMPGITSLEVKSKSAYGSLREAIVSFQCWDVRQLEELEQLYMRPGYTVMVEWGWKPYLDNTGALKTNSAKRFNDQVLNGGVSKETIWKKIFNESSDGNYDAVYGFVRNFSWSARPDGGYDCTTTIITMGEVAESLKVNYGAFDSNIDVKTNGIFGTLPSTTRSFASRLFGSLFSPGTSVADANTVRNAYSENIIAGIAAELYYYAIADPDAGAAPSSYMLGGANGYDLAKVDIKANNKQGPTITNGDTQVYIKLGDFIRILNKHVLLRDKNDSIVGVSVHEPAHNGSSGTPLLCLADRHQISTNPFVCLIKNNAYEDPKTNLKITDLNINGIIASTNGYYKALKESYLTIPSATPDPDKGEFGIIANIYVNVDYIYGLVTTSELESKDKNEKNDISLYDFLKGMMDGINSAIGNVANFDIHIDGIDSIARIIDIHYVEDKSKSDAYKEIQSNKIEVGNTKSIVRNYRLESSIYPELSTMIAIGAQAQGGSLATNTNTLVDYNKGLIDRIVTDRVSPLNISTGSTITDFDARLTEVQGNYAVLAPLFTELVPDWWDFGVGDYDIEQAARYANALKDIISFFLSYTTNGNSNRDILPTKLSLEMDGIGGMIIGNMFSISDDVIPKGYKGGGTTGAKTGYIITGLAHSLKNNDWITTIDAQFTILDTPQSYRVPWDKVPELSATSINVSNAGTGILPPAPSAPTASSNAFSFGLPLGSPTIFTSMLYRNTSKTWNTLVTSGPDSNHYGIDMAGPKGSVRDTNLDSVVGGKGTSGDFVYAVQEGEVIYANKPPAAEVDGFGRWVVIKHDIAGTKFVSVYGHVAPYSIKVSVGDRVSKGTPIAMVGDEGTSSGIHLHFELWNGIDYYPSRTQKRDFAFRERHLHEDPFQFLPYFQVRNGKITDPTITTGRFYTVA